MHYPYGGSLVVCPVRTILALKLCHPWTVLVLSRYCSGKKNKGKKGKFGVDYSGASHIAELHALLGATVMVSNMISSVESGPGRAGG